MNTKIVMMMFVVLIYNTLLTITPKKTYDIPEYYRASKQYRLKSKIVKDVVPFKKKMLAKMTSNVVENVRIPLDLSQYTRRPIPMTFHGVQKPLKDELKAKRFSRMGKIVSS